MLPAYGLFIAAGEHFLFLCLVTAIYTSLLVQGQRNTEQTIVGAVLIVFWTLSGLVVLAGGLSLRRLNSYGVARTGCFAAMIPGVTICPVIGLPVGIWALVVACSPDVWACFRDRKR